MCHNRFHWLSLALIAMLAVVSMGAAAIDDVPTPSGPITLELKDGGLQRGEPVSYRDGILVVRYPFGAGMVERGFPREEIARIDFPGGDIVAQAKVQLAANDSAAALAFLEALWRQRAPFLDLLQAETIDLLSALPTVHLEVGDPYRAIALARNLMPHATMETTENQLHASILLGHYRLRLYEETRELARAWVHRQKEFPTSALGWMILAELALLEDDFEQAIWLALQPIALAGPEPIPYLKECYALAIHGFHQQEETERAIQLYREMLDRDLSWPTDERFAKTAAFYRNAVQENAGPEPAEPGPDLDLRPPEKDLNLPLQKVRKLLPNAS